MLSFNNITDIINDLMYDIMLKTNAKTLNSLLSINKHFYNYKLSIWKEKFKMKNLDLTIFYDLPIKLNEWYYFYHNYKKAVTITHQIVHQLPHTFIFDNKIDIIDHLPLDDKIRQIIKNVYNIYVNDNIKQIIKIKMKQICYTVENEHTRCLHHIIDKISQDIIYNFILKMCYFSMPVSIN